MRSFLIGALLALSASSALAEERYTRQVIAQLDGLESRAVSTGKSRLFRSPIFQLNEGESRSYQVNLTRGGSYLIGGVCDNDCPDLDIALIDPNGRQVANDTLADSLPVVGFDATRGGAYTIRVTMYDCNASPCSAGLTVMGVGAGGGGPRPAPAAGRYDRQVNNQLDSFEETQSRAVRLFRSPIFRLNEGERQDYNVQLVAGVSYKIGGVCDNDCPDLDIKLLDANGYELATDDLTDSLPIVAYRPVRSGNYRVRVVMYNCNAGPCSAGVTVMARN